jgi:hypothetical protein
MSKKPVTTTWVARCTDIDTANMELLHEHVWISRTQRAQRWAIKGVMTSLIDIAIVNRDENPDIPEDHVRVVEICKKNGKYGGVRDRVCARYVPKHQSPNICVAVFCDENGALHVGDTVLRHFRFENKISLDRPDHIEGIIRWHFDRYYRFLDQSDVHSATVQLSEYIAEHGDVTLAETNRAASRILYRHARDRGFRKLTLREQQRLELFGQWHSEAEYAAAQARIQSSAYSPTGASEYSLCVARPAGSLGSF